MRVAIVTESFLPSINGVTNSVLRIVDSLLGEGHEVLVVAPTAPSEGYRGVRVVTTPSVMLAGFPVAIPTPAVATELDAFAPDLIHAAAPFWLGGSAIAYAAKKDIPSVAVYQTDVSGYMERYGLDFAAPVIDGITSAIHRQANVTLAPTPDGRDYLQKLGVTNVALWGRGVDTQLFHPGRRGTQSVSQLRSTIAPSGGFIVGYVGRLAPEKQVERMKELCGLPGVTLLIVGDGPSRPELEDTFRGYPAVFTGRLEADALADAYAAMDVFVHCGTEETFGQTIQEAQATGLPVVAPKVGGQRHLIRHGDTGFLVEPSRWGAYREQVTQLLEDDILRARVGHSAVSAVAHKTWQANNQELLRYYRELVAPTAVSALAA